MCLRGGAYGILTDAAPRHNPSTLLPSSQSPALPLVTLHSRPVSDDGNHVSHPERWETLQVQASCNCHTMPLVKITTGPSCSHWSAASWTVSEKADRCYRLLFCELWPRTGAGITVLNLNCHRTVLSVKRTRWHPPLCSAAGPLPASLSYNHRHARHQTSSR